MLPPSNGRRLRVLIDAGIMHCSRAHIVRAVDICTIGQQEFQCLMVLQVDEHHQQRCVWHLRFGPAAPGKRNISGGIDDD